jgi:sporulation protein YlmC with PRC-barrel domain
MLKHVMAAAAVSALALTSALAQQTSSPPASSPSTLPPPAASQSTPSSPSASATTPSTAATGKFVTKQSPDQFLASKFKGTDVIGADDKKIGDVSDILFDKDKKILAYIVGVGGFLGIGAKDVALEPSAFQTVPGSSATDFKLRLSMTKDELKEAPAFEPYKEARPATTSSNAPTRPMGAPAPTAPPPKQ